MAQVTTGLVDEFRRAIKAGAPPPYTANEFEQLCFAWEALQRLRKRTLLFNPYTGQPRHPADIASDPSGILMMDPDEPVYAKD